MQKCHQDPRLVKGINGALAEMFSTLIDYELSSAKRWYDGWRGYVNDKKGGKAQYLNYSFPRGRLVMVNLFGHMGNELTYSHPAVVLCSRTNWMLIGPISTSAYNSSIDTHIPLELADKVVHKSGVKLEAVRAISKSRVERDLKVSVRTQKLDEIDLKLMQLFCPSVSRKMEIYEAEIARLTTLLEGQKSSQQVAVTEFSL